MSPLESSFFFKFQRYFFLIYVSFIILYWLIDSFEKSLRVVQGESIFFSSYALSTILIIAVNQLNNALFCTTFFWLYEYISLNESESTLVLNLSLLRLLRPLFLSIFLLHLFLFCLHEKVMPFLIEQQIAKKEALHFKKKRSNIRWISLSNYCFARQLDNEIDMIYTVKDEGDNEISLLHKKVRWLSSDGLTFFKESKSNQLLHFVRGSSNDICFKKNESLFKVSEQKVRELSSFFFRSIQIYSLFIWFWYSIVYHVSFWWILIFWHFIYFFFFFISIFLAQHFLWYDMLYLPLGLWVLGLCILIWRVHLGFGKRGHFYGDHR